MQQKDFKMLLNEASSHYRPVKEEKEKQQQNNYISLGELITPQGRLLADIESLTRRS